MDHGLVIGYIIKKDFLKIHEKEAHRHQYCGEHQGDETNMNPVADAVVTKIKQKCELTF